MKKTSLITFILLVLIIALGVAIYLQYKPTKEITIETAVPALPLEPVKKPIVHYPVPESAVITQAPPVQTSEQKAEQPQLLPETLPKVQESDQSIQQALEILFKGNQFYKLLVSENFIQRLVATINNLPEKRLPRAHLPITPPGGKFIVSGTTEAPQTSSRNNQRYASYVSLIESIDEDMAIKIYVHFYPLFQSAYEQLGYQNAYFNDRLVYVIDHLLNTPNPPDPILLAQPAVLYTYADPNLENLSAGQKILLRIGQDQHLRMTNVLTRYHQKLTNLHP